ncbi:SIR2 family protein [Isobaculum melis]|uniref:SIR2-like domain-containing protein n=1 Tax=Isobaculum melis TaxID=142588 RepID=A0A1H9UG52_9LACT|nr:SIR2 family protein [Isobaculum melis]SES08147.1 SIR2-like domain-containing protein [Isobaculum melis]
MSNYPPVLFIGPQILKKSYQHWPTQIELVQLLWAESHYEVDESKFYARLNKLEQEIKLAHPTWQQQQIEAKMLAQISTQIAFEYDEAFYNGTFKLDGFSQKDAYVTKIPPFKQGMKEILQVLAPDQLDISGNSNLGQLLEATPYLVTSSYAVFIERILEARQKQYRVFMGAKGIFDEAEDTLNIYKINGSIHQPASLIFTEEDKAKNKNDEVVLFTKLAALAEERPLLFVGYETTDVSYQDLLKGIFGYFEDREAAQATISLVNFNTANEAISQKTYLDEATKQEIQLIESCDEALIFQYLKETHFNPAFQFEAKQQAYPAEDSIKSPLEKLEQLQVASQKRATAFEMVQPAVTIPAAKDPALEKKQHHEVPKIEHPKSPAQENAQKNKEKFDLEAFLAHLELEEQQQNKAELDAFHREKETRIKNAQKQQIIAKKEATKKVQTAPFSRANETIEQRPFISRKEKYQQEKTGYERKKQQHRHSIEA